MATENWLCPVCGLVDMPYGTMTCEGKPACGNEAHATGQYFVDENGALLKVGQSPNNGIGISEIAHSEKDET